MASMLNNIWNAITRLPIDQLGCNFGGRVPSCSRHVRHVVVAMATASALNILQLWASGDWTREPILMKFGKQQQVRTTMTVMWSNIKIFIIQNGGRPPVGKYLKCHNSPTNGPTGMQLFVIASHHVLDMSVMWRLPWQQPLPSNGALNILQLWASGGRMREPISMKFGTQQHVRNTMTDTWWNTIFKMADGRHVDKY